MLLTISQKFSVKHLCWSLFLKKLQAWWCATFSRKKTLTQVFPCKFSEIFKKNYFVEHAQTDAWVKWTKKIVFSKSIHRKTPVMASFLVQFQPCGLTVFLISNSQMLFYENWEVLQNMNFTEQCCATASDFLWHFQCITYLISNKSVQS